MLFGERGERGEARFDILMLARLDEAEVAFRERDGGVARQHAENGDAQVLDGARDEPAMPLARNAIEDHAGNLHGRIVGCEAAQQRGR